MKPIFLLMIIVGILLLLCLLTAYICFRMAFYVTIKERKRDRSFEIPPGKIYEPYRELMLGWMREVRAMPHEDVYIRSCDGLTLHGQFFEYAPGAPIELMLHGYRGTAERDLCGGVQRAFALGRSALIVDQRAAGKSGGQVITFGIKESRDCRAWVDFMIGHFGPNVRIILTGISMGAATVMITAGNPLPANVIGVLADCGFSTARDIIKKEIRRKKLPADVLYPFVRMGAILFGGFDPDETSALEAMKTCRLPIIFFHGDRDKFVPCEMSKVCYEACKSKKHLHLVPGAGHGLAFPADQDTYIRELREFFGPDASAKEN
ncbi:MAG: alpha/beta hydrolase [Oscillospiraceae bacterium]|nr:alpha/beta hydrolase [Oscillospiraceae bacterium]